MNQKWYIPIIVIALAFLGIGLDNTVVPNQEIVVQFNNEGVTAQETQKAVAAVKKQLQSIGGTNIQITKSQQGNLKITYYSAMDVAAVRSIFSDDTLLKIGFTSNTDQAPTDVPANNPSNNYQLNIDAIDYGQEGGFDFDGFVIEIKGGNDRYVDPFVYAGISEEIIRLCNSFEKIAYEVQLDCSLHIDYSTFNFPEVRAGPLS
ncbi:hypothetical protein G5B37_06165 [Rasiella rasia]|uniref:Uncharacterized protein n=1 Tax=Rasiella rasia TaxID=2744027 RepID=A0A6G6GKN8_9FLAO|nr:hypothetical protein [Rasiella rasia]QIE59156.1 hypothetical protein G5B37_06165 [Rasiella rasia]